MKRTSGLLLLFVALALGACHDDDDDFFFVRIAIADLDADGFVDVVVGAPRHDGAGAPGARRGAVFVHFGGPSGPPAAPDLTIFGSEDGAEFGHAIAFVGDVNRGGAPDLLVGAPFDDGDGNASEDGLDRGRAFLFFGGPAMDALADVTTTGAEPDARLGWSVARIADTNGDGFDEFLIGAPGDDADGNATDDGSDRGRAFLHLGRRVPDGIADLVLDGAEDGAGFGSAVASAGDLNAGGAVDLAVGAPGDDADGNTTDDGDDRGSVFVFYGGSVLDAVPDLIFDGDEDGAAFGSAVAGGADLDGDGIDDLLVGAPAHDGGGGAAADRGEAYVFAGAVTPDLIPDWIVGGLADGDAFGSAVAIVGDVDGDGGRDIVVGAPFEDPGALADAGSAYFFRGGAALDPIEDVVFDGAEAGARLGSAVSGPGDVDGTAGRDVVVGAPGDDADGNASDDGVDRGRAFVFSGGAGLDATPDVVISGSQDGALAASALAH